MTLSQLIVPHIPYLRRHARLLTGSQALGDELVRLCLELVVAEPEWLAGEDLRTQLFRAFHATLTRVHETVSDDTSVGLIELKERVKDGVAGLPEIERRVLLLIAVEEFTQDQTAYILGLTRDEVRQAESRARNALLEKVSVRTLIIEDEPIVALDIARIVKEMGHRVAGMAGHEDESVALAEELEPGLLLVDLRLENDTDGAAAAKAILESYVVPIVFITGYPERLLTGNRLEPAFVVAKPFSSEVLKVTIAHALAVYQSPAEGSRHRDKLLDKLKEVTGRALLSWG